MLRGADHPVPHRIWSAKTSDHEYVRCVQVGVRPAYRTVRTSLSRRQWHPAVDQPAPIGATASGISARRPTPQNRQGRGRTQTLRQVRAPWSPTMGATAAASTEAACHRGEMTQCATPRGPMRLCGTVSSFPHSLSLLPRPSDDEKIRGLQTGARLDERKHHSGRRLPSTPGCGVIASTSAR